MSITREQIREQLEKFLPKTVNFSQDASTGDQDPQATFDMLMRIVKTALVLDADVPYYLVYLAAQRTLADVNAALSLLNELTGSDQLLVAESAPATRMNFTRLANAYNLLNQFSAAVAAGNWGTDRLAEFEAEVTAFLEEEVKDNITDRNQEAIDKDIRDTAIALETAWAKVLELRTTLQGVADAYTGADLRLDVTTGLITDIQREMAAIFEASSGASVEEQALQVETIAAATAAMQAALRIIAAAPTSTGSTVIAPRSDGATGATYLTMTGLVRPLPLEIILEGTTGRIQFDLVVASETGTPVDDYDGDSLTPTLQDTSADLSDVEVGHTLTLARTGTTHEITGIDLTNARLTLSPEISTASSPMRYLVTVSPPGTYLKDGGQDFWTEHADGRTLSTIQASGSKGAFLRDTKTSGTDGSNQRTNGTTGVTAPRKDSGTAGKAYMPIAQGTSGQWGEEISPVPNEGMQIKVSPSGDEPGFSDDHLYDADGPFASPVEVGDYVVLYLDAAYTTDANSYYGVFRISAIDSDNKATIDLDGNTWTTFGGLLSSGIVDTSINVQLNMDVFSLRKLVASGGDFLVNGVAIGDKVIITRGNSTNNPWGDTSVNDVPEELTVAAVTSATELELDYPVGDVLETPQLFDPSSSEGVNYETSAQNTVSWGSSIWHVRAVSPDSEYRFSDTSAQFLTDGVVAGDDLVISGSAAVDGTYEISQVLSETDVIVTTAFPAYEQGVTWEVRRSDYRQVYKDVNGDFLSSGVQAGDNLEIASGTEAGAHEVATVESETILTVTLADQFGTATTINNTYEVQIDDDEFLSATANFLSSGVVAGMQLSITAPFTGVYEVASVDSQTQITLTTSFDPGDVGFDGATWEIYPAGDISSRFQQQDGVDFTTIPVSGTINNKPAYLEVEGTDYDVRYLDEEIPAEDSIVVINETPSADTSYTLDWELRAGDTTTVFLDTVAPPFSGMDVGDTIVLYPGTDDEERVTIADIPASNRVTLNEEVGQGQDPVPYATFNDVRPGHDVLVANRRFSVVDIESVGGVACLKLDPPLPLFIGSDFAYTVVPAGVSLVTRRLKVITSVDKSGSPVVASTALVDEDIHLMYDTPVRGRVLNVITDGAVRYLDIALPVRAGQQAVNYRIVTDDIGRASELETSAALGDVEVGDVVTVWSQSRTRVATTEDALALRPPLPSQLSAQHFAVTRGGSQYFGRYLIFEYLDSALSFTQSLTSLFGHLAEVLIDHGENKTEIYGLQFTGTLVDDQDGDDTTGVLRDLTVDLSTPNVGDRLLLVVNTGSSNETFVTYLSEKVSTNEVRFLPEVTNGTLVSWRCDRSSVSAALEEAWELQGQLEAYQEVLEGYALEVNTSVDEALALMREHGFDRAVDLLYQGDVEGFLTMEYDGASFSRHAQVQVASLGQILRRSDVSE